MEPEQTENSTYLPATSPAWAAYYQQAKERRKLGRGERGRIQRASKVRRKREALIMVISSAAVAAMTFGFYVLLSR